MSLQRLVLPFEGDTLTVRILYRRKAGPNPGAKARVREVTEITRTGLEHALAAVERRVDMVGISGYEVREDTISADAAKAPLNSGGHDGSGPMLQGWGVHS